MFHVKHSDFVFSFVANFLIVAVEQGSGGGEFLFWKYRSDNAGTLSLWKLTFEIDMVRFQIPLLEFWEPLCYKYRPFYP